MRLSHLLYSQGFGTRRACADRVLAGTVSIGGRVCDDPEEDIDTAGLVFTVDGVDWPFHAQALVLLHGLSRFVPHEHWQQMAQDMSSAFKAGRFEEGLGRAIDAVHDLLYQHFPLRPGAANPNELPDRPYVR